jgi:Cys-tRNA(Pro)/Cys-tRNA(Cys) deacylase
MSEFPPVAQALSKLAVQYQIFRHSEPVNSLEQAANARGQLPGQVVRSILFRIGEDNYLMVLIAGPEQISWPMLRAYLGQSRLTLATEAEVLAITGYRVGAVSPYGLPRQMRILADENVFTYAEISIGSGLRGTAIILKSSDLRSTLDNIEIGNFANYKSSSS